MNDLISAAREILGEFTLGNASNAGSVAAALRTDAGNIYTGISLHLACGIGFCAEHGAVAEMLKHRERVITEIVAVSNKGVLAPCGRCRELMLQVSSANSNTRIVLSKTKSVPLHELLPHHWLVVEKNA